MNLAAAIAVLTTLAVSLLLTRRMLKVALARGLLDIPNARSSHETPTPRGGGVAIVVATGLGCVLLWACGALNGDVLLALLGGGITVAIVGFIDDHRPLPVRTRLFMHIAAAVWAVAWLGGFPPLLIGNHLVHFHVMGYVLGVLVLTWTLNLFNFMDGIDGLAASEAIFIAGGAAGLVLIGGHEMGGVWLDLVFAAACAGFLVFNWPPARIFMGDVGSGFIGFVIGVMALTATRSAPQAAWVWLLLGGLFFVDATMTLVRRVARGERAQTAHRSHAYQWLSRRWRSHRRVTLIYTAVNLLWCLPGAILIVSHPSAAIWIVLGTLAPVAVAAACAGAGKAER